MSDIVVGYDGTDSAKVALDQAIRLAKELGDRVVIAFGYAPGGYGGGEVPEHRKAVKEHGERVTREAAETASSAGVDSEVQLINEHGADALSDIATQHQARMIVIGTHGESALRGAMIGSTAHKLIHIAEVPVLVVRP
jgi:nucleotide-binding universal stress UspA family protein